MFYRQKLFRYPIEPQKEECQRTADPKKKILCSTKIGRK